MFRTIPFRRCTAWIVAAGLGLSLVAGATGTGVAAAGQKAAGKTGKQGMGPRWKEALQKLNLSEEQKGRIRSVEAKYQDELARLRDAGDDKQTRRRKVKALRQKMREDVLAILTEDQRAQLKAEMRKVRATQKAAKAKTKTEAGAKTKSEAKAKAKSDAKAKKGKAKSGEDAA
jgi:Spy/CpxP family protein refolding chaperone